MCMVISDFEYVCRPIGCAPDRFVPGSCGDTRKYRHRVARSVRYRTLAVIGSDQRLRGTGQRNECANLKYPNTFRHGRIHAHSKVNCVFSLSSASTRKAPVTGVSPAMAAVV